MMNLVIEIGLGYIKVKNDKNEKRLFPSIVAEKKTGPLMGIYNRNSDYMVTYHTSREEVTLCVGNAAINNMGKRKDRLNEDEVRCFLMCALGILGEQQELVNLMVVMPTGYTDIENKLINDLGHQKLEIAINGEKKTRVIQSISFFPETVVGYYNQVLKDNKINYELIKVGNSIGIIDIGYKHVKYLIMTSGKDGIKKIDNLSGTLEDQGMKICYNSIYENLGELKDELDLEDVEESIVKNNGILECRRGQIDLTSECHKIYGKYITNLEVQIKRVWGIEKDLLTKLVIVGGPVNTLKGYLNDSFGPCEIEEESIFYGCNGGLAIQSLNVI